MSQAPCTLFFPRRGFTPHPLLPILPTDYPGYQKVDNDEVRKKFEEAWGVSLSPKPGLKATEVFPAAIEGKIRGLYICGEDPIVSDPDTKHIVKALESLDFLVVQGYSENAPQVFGLTMAAFVACAGGNQETLTQVAMLLTESPTWGELCDLWPLLSDGRIACILQEEEDIFGTMAVGIVFRAPDAE